MNRNEKIPANAAKNPRPEASATPRSRKRKNARKLRLVTFGILGCFLALVIFGALFLILPLFEVRKVVIVGNETTPTATILEAADIQEGDSIFGINEKAVKERIWNACPYVDGIGISKSFGTVKITVTESQNPMYSTYGQYSYSLNREFRVLEIREDPEPFDSFLFVELPPITGLKKGEVLQFQEDGIDRSYISGLLDHFEEIGLLEQVTGIDFRQKYNISYVLNGNVRIVLGKIADLEPKMKLAQEILLAKNENGECAVVDVSDLKKATYRPVEQNKLLLQNTDKG